MKDQSKVEDKETSVAIYHRVYAREGFEKSAQILFDLVRKAQGIAPDKPRILYLDIDGHRNRAGGFDRDMAELQTEFLFTFLGDFLTEVHVPLAHARSSKKQRNDIPDRLDIQASRSS